MAQDQYHTSSKYGLMAVENPPRGHPYSTYLEKPGSFLTLEMQNIQ